MRRALSATSEETGGFRRRALRVAARLGLEPFGFEEELAARAGRFRGTPEVYPNCLEAVGEK